MTFAFAPTPLWPFSTAIFSPDRTWRYELTRTWDSTRKPIAFIGLNPSTADETANDPTVRRCIGFAERWGYGGLIMLNLFAFRATDPRVMRAAPEPEGPDNDAYIVDAADQAGMVVAAWGVGGAYRGRDRAVVALLDRPLMALGVTKDGHPRHPLYVRGDVVPVQWQVSLPESVNE